MKHKATDFLYILNSGWIVKTKPELRLAVTQAGSRYMGRSASACGFGCSDKCYKAKCIWLARLWAAELIITAELARQHTIDAALGVEGRLDLNSDEAQCLYTVYLIKICVCVICVLASVLSQELDGNSICETVEKESEGVWRRSKK